MMQPDVSPTPSLTVYYDGACPVCRREIAGYRRQAGAEHCAWVDASQARADELGPDLSPTRALQRMHVRRADGRLVEGAAAFALLWQAFPATRWLGRVAGWAPVTLMLEGAYRAFLRIRPLWRPRGLSPVALPQPGITAALQADLRSDHAGETGAVAIYQGILAVTRDPQLRAFAQHHQATEREHLRLIEDWLEPRHRSRLLPLWRLAGWMTGALPAAFGARAVYRTIESVETFVDHHYEAQIRRIDSLPPDDERTRLRTLLLQCQAEEVAHRDDAASRLVGSDRAAALARVWTSLVAAGSQAAVVLARRI